MKTAFLKRLPLGALLLLPVLSWAQAQESKAVKFEDLKTVKLNEPNKKRGLPVMEALSLRASVREWSDKDVGLQDLSDLLWAANGINRPDGKRTAASAMNAQDVDIYVLMKDGAYLYDAAGHALVPVAAGDLRSQFMMSRPPAKPGRGGPGGAGDGGQKPGAAGGPGRPGGPGGPPSPAPIQLILVSDVSRFPGGTPELKLEWGAIDVGLVSQNIAVFCAGTGMVTRPRASIDKDKIKALLKLQETQHPFLNHPVGYPK
ncbi:MAG TPA: nitroreductase family protein [Candidatus Aminicenantes bacterium]|mgnify:CR=1 FL=1|nr:nitroreductase family protein [Candidatus Aminicenantes bacterium]